MNNKQTKNIIKPAENSRKHKVKVFSFNSFSLSENEIPLHAYGVPELHSHKSQWTGTVKKSSRNINSNLLTTMSFIVAANVAATSNHFLRYFVADTAATHDIRVETTNHSDQIRQNPQFIPHGDDYDDEAVPGTFGSFVAAVCWPKTEETLKLQREENNPHDTQHSYQTNKLLCWLLHAYHIHLIHVSDQGWYLYEIGILKVWS